MYKYYTGGGRAVIFSTFDQNKPTLAAILNSAFKSGPYLNKLTPIKHKIKAKDIIFNVFPRDKT